MNPPQATLSGANRDLYAHQNQHDNFSSAAAATAAAALSQPHIPVPSPNTINGKKRKATGVPGSRGVANLTPDQLAKKRANDREAQRAIRERTKNTIEGLEERIRELESQQPFQELQRVAQERDRALAECDQLRSKLAMVQSVIGSTQPLQQSQPNLHGMFDAFDRFIDPLWLTEGEVELAALTAQQSPLPPLNTPHAPQYPQNGAGQSYEQQHLHPELRSPRSDTRASPVGQTVAGPSYATDATSLRKWSPSLEHLPSSHFGSSNGLQYESRLPAPPAMLEQSNSNGERLELNYVLEPKQQTASTSSSAAPPTYPLSSSPGRPISEQIPVNLPPTCPLDSLLVDFLKDSQKQIANGVPIRNVIGPEYPSFHSLQYPDPNPKGITHPLSSLMTDILSKFPSISGLPERVAVLYTMFLLMRWMICPCEICYKRLPDWLRPLKEQFEIAHPAWSDYVPWPIIRLCLINSGDVQFGNFFVPFTSKLWLNWPYPTDQVLISAADTEDESAIMMNPVFESHLRDLRNWSVGSVFKTTFPELVDDAVRIED